MGKNTKLVNKNSIFYFMVKKKLKKYKIGKKYTYHGKGTITRVIVKKYNSHGKKTYTK